MLYEEATQNGMFFLCNEYGKYARAKAENGEKPVSFLKYALGRFYTTCVSET